MSTLSNRFAAGFLSRLRRLWMDASWHQPWMLGLRRPSLPDEVAQQIIEGEEAPLTFLSHVSRRALEVVNRHPDDEKDSRIAQVAEILADAGDAAGASEVASRVENQKASRSAWKHAAISYARQGEVDTALAMVRHIEEASDRNQVVYEVFKAVLELEDFDAAAAIMNRCDDGFRAEFMLAPMLGQALAKRDSQGDLSRVVLTSAGAEPKAALLAKVAEEYAKRGDAKRALAAIDQADAGVARLLALPRITEAFIAAGKHRELAAAAGELLTPEEQNQIIEELAKAAIQAGDFAEGLAIASQMKHSLFRRVLMNRLCLLLPRETRREQLRQVLQESLDVDCRDLILGQLALDYSNRGEADAEQAIATALQIADQAKRGRAIRQVAELLVCAGRTEQLLAILGQAHDPIERSLCLSGMARGFSSLEDASQALAYVRQIEDSQERCSALLQVVSALGRRKDLEQARRHLEEALVTAGELHDAPQRASGLAHIASAMASTGASQPAREVLDRVPHLLEMSGAEVEGALRHVAVAQAKLGDFSLAIETSHRIGEKVQRWFALAEVASQLAAAGNFAQANELLDEFQGAKEKDDVLQHIAATLMGMGECRQALLHAARIAGDLKRNMTFGLLISIAIETNGVEKTLAALEQISERAIVDQALGSFAERLFCAGDLERAIAISNRVMDWDEHGLFFRMAIAKVLAEPGGLERARQAVEQFQDPIRKDQFCEALAEEVADRQDFRNAVSVANRIAKPDTRQEALTEVAVMAGSKGKISDFLGSLDKVLALQNRDEVLEGSVRRIAGEHLEFGIEAAKSIRGRDARCAALSEISMSLLHHGKPEQALEVARQMDSGVHKSMVLYAISMQFTEEGKITEALASAPPADRADSRFLCGRASYEIIRKLIGLKARGGHLEEATRMANRVREQSSRAQFLADISLALYEKGDRPRGDKWFSQAMKVAGRIKDEVDRARSLLKLASWLSSTPQRADHRRMKLAFADSDKRLARCLLGMLLN